MENPIRNSTLCIALHRNQIGWQCNVMIQEGQDSTTYVVSICLHAKIVPLCTKLQCRNNCYARRQVPCDRRGWRWRQRHATPRLTVGPNSKNSPKIRFENPCNWLIILVPAAIWQLLNMKRMQFTEIEVNLLKFCWKLKLVKSRQVNLFLANSGHLEPLCGVAAEYSHFFYKIRPEPSRPIKPRK